MTKFLSHALFMFIIVVGADIAITSSRCICLCVCGCDHDQNDLKLRTALVLDIMSKPIDFGFKTQKVKGQGYRVR